VARLDELLQATLGCLVVAHRGEPGRERPVGGVDAGAGAGDMVNAAPTPPASNDKQQQQQSNNATTMSIPFLLLAMVYTTY